MAAFDWIDDLEMQLSIYRDDSELSRINREAFEAPVVVEPNLFGLLERCAALNLETAGAFDVSSGPLVRLWGFERRQGRVPTDEQIAEALRCVGMEHIRLDSEAKSVQFLRPGMLLNLAAVGKGYTLDRVAERMAAARFGSALLSAGHSSIVALGRPGWDDAWTIDLADPRDPKRRLASVRLRDRSLSTSGLSEQSFVHEGKRYGHLLDPRTGRPVDGVWQTTVAAPDAATAEALSTAFFVQGLDWAEDYCRRRPEMAAVIVPAPAPDRPLEVHVLGEIDVPYVAEGVILSKRPTAPAKFLS
jgi:thiamine biosynthesis lipoprotein